MIVFYNDWQIRVRQIPEARFCYVAFGFKEGRCIQTLPQDDAEQALAAARERIDLEPR